MLLDFFTENHSNANFGQPKNTRDSSIDYSSIERLCITESEEYIELKLDFGQRKA